MWQEVGLVAGNKQNSVSFSTGCSYHTSLYLFLNLESDIYFSKSHHFWAAQPFDKARGLWGSGILYLVHLFGRLAFSPYVVIFYTNLLCFLLDCKLPKVGIRSPLIAP